MKNLTSLDEILDKQYGSIGEPEREKWEQEFEAFRLGVLLEEARIKQGLSREEYSIISIIKDSGIATLIR